VCLPVQLVDSYSRAAGSNPVAPISCGRMRALVRLPTRERNPTAQPTLQSPAAGGTILSPRRGSVRFHSRPRAALVRVRITRRRQTSHRHDAEIGEMMAANAHRHLLIPVIYYVVERFAANRRQRDPQGLPTGESSIAIHAMIRLCRAPIKFCLALRDSYSALSTHATVCARLQEGRIHREQSDCPNFGRFSFARRIRLPTLRTACCATSNC
jgi:hypothetical protein